MPCSRRTADDDEDELPDHADGEAEQDGSWPGAGALEGPRQPGGDDPGECGHRQRGGGPGAENPAAGVLRQRSRVEVGRHACRSGRVCPGGRVGHGCSLLCVGQIDASTLGTCGRRPHRQKAGFALDPRRRFASYLGRRRPGRLAQYVHDVRSRWFLPRTYGRRRADRAADDHRHARARVPAGLTAGRRRPACGSASAAVAIMVLPLLRAATLPVRRSGGVLGAGGGGLVRGRAADPVREQRVRPRHDDRVPARERTRRPAGTDRIGCRARRGGDHRLQPARAHRQSACSSSRWCSRSPGSPGSPCGSGPCRPKPPRCGRPRPSANGTRRPGIAVAEERARIARELHDIVAHAVSVMVLQVGAVRHGLPAELDRRTGTRCAASSRSGGPH